VKEVVEGEGQEFVKKAGEKRYFPVPKRYFSVPGRFFGREIEHRGEKSGSRMRGRGKGFVL
jgi:hypothetical protein